MNNPPNRIVELAVNVAASYPDEDVEVVVPEEKPMIMFGYLVMMVNGEVEVWTTGGHPKLKPEEKAEIYHNSRFTAAYLPSTRTLSISICNSKDQYSRKLGVTRAIGRLDAKFPVRAALDFKYMLFRKYPMRVYRGQNIMLLIINTITDAFKSRIERSNNGR